MAASPFQLTAFGQAAVRCGFSPKSCRAILKHFADAVPPDSALDVIARMVITLGWLPEQPDRSCAIEISKPSRSCRIKVADVDNVVRAWIEGVALLDIFINLPSVKNSKSRVKVSEWLAGTGVPVSWDDEFDGFVEWVNGVLVAFASWLMRTCGTLSAIIDGWPSEVRWLQLSEFCEFGVDTTWAVTAIRRNAPASREVLSKMGRIIFDHWATEDDPLGLAGFKGLLADEAAETAIQQTINNEFAPQSGTLDSARRVLDWMREQA